VATSNPTKMGLALHVMESSGLQMKEMEEKEIQKGR